MFRFTIRDALWLMIVVAMGGAWWADRKAVNLARQDCEMRLKRIADILRETQARGVFNSEAATYIITSDGSETILVSKHD